MDEWMIKYTGNGRDKLMILGMDGWMECRTEEWMNSRMTYVHQCMYRPLYVWICRQTYVDGMNGNWSSETSTKERKLVILRVEFLFTYAVHFNICGPLGPTSRTGYKAKKFFIK